ncbi:MAG: Asp-tRNA(Asn)/Glu-tRNA(Gln) amidotransferase subunit GatC [Fimbriimonadaceae bacterium]
MAISLDEVRHVARLARLQLNEGELMSFQGELNALLGHFQDIQEVEVGGLPAKPHAVALKNVWSHDTIGPALPRDEALRNAPKSKAGLFIVPTIIEE